MDGITTSPLSPVTTVVSRLQIVPETAQRFPAFNIKSLMSTGLFQSFCKNHSKSSKGYCPKWRWFWCHCRSCVRRALLRIPKVLELSNCLKLKLSVHKSNLNLWHAVETLETIVDLVCSWPLTHDIFHVLEVWIGIIDITWGFQLDDSQWSEARMYMNCCSKMIVSVPVLFTCSIFRYFNPQFC